MLVLFETPAGYALFKVKDEGKLDNVDELAKEFATPDGANNIVKLKAFHKFEDTTAALASATALVESKLDKSLKTFLKKKIVAKELSDTLAVADAKLGATITKKLGVSCVANSKVQELMRGLRQQQDELLTGLSSNEMKAMSLGLSHSLSRYKLKFSPDKVDTMIVQAIGLLDELDKELNTYAMRVKEWFGWHFPELNKIITDNVQFIKSIQRMRIRSMAAGKDFSDILEPEVEERMKEAALISMGTEISDEDVNHILELCEEVLSMMAYRSQLSDYLKNRMNAIAPNLTVMVGELVGARLIAHAGSLMSLAKHPASTVQILGAEKALFRALKTKHETPKYGLIYHASLVGQTQPKFKGKISRVLAAKAALAIRVDALGEHDEATIGFESRAKVEARLAQLEGKAVASISRAGAGASQSQKYDGPAAPVRAYNAAGDVTMGDDSSESEAEVETPKKKAKKEKKDKSAKKSAKKEKKRKRKREESDDDGDESDAEEAAEVETPKKKKKKEKKSKTPKSEKKAKKKAKKQKTAEDSD